ncbi:hypothetical protein LDENG_00199520 [Lucifuga dentata]|nr:hypothetical protein LDENG_00199520 [Lucifuga dentata]
MNPVSLFFFLLLLVNQDHHRLLLTQFCSLCVFWREDIHSQKSPRIWFKYIYRDKFPSEKYEFPLDTICSIISDTSEFLGSRLVRNFTCSLLGSHESPERPAAAREAASHHAVQTQQRPASPRRPRGSGPDQRLQQLPPAPLQEARIQKLLQHLSSLRHPAPVQHPPVCC